MNFLSLPGDDCAPRWLPGTDTLFYAASTVAIARGVPRVWGGGPPASPPFMATQGLPSGEGFLLALQPGRGVAHPLLPALHDTVGDPTVIIAAAEASPDRARIAYMVPEFHQPVERACQAVWASCIEPGESYPPTPILSALHLFVRDRGDPAPHSDQSGLRLPLAGVETLPDPEGRPGVSRVEVHYHPFHVAVRSEGLPILGPSWDPAGDRVVFSDGLRLRIWVPGQDQAAVIPGTDAAVSPAWSPTGQWIAYTERVAGETLAPYACDLRGGSTFSSPLRCVTEHRYYPLVGKRLRLASPDGADNLDLGDGMDPAWSADGHTLYFVRGQRIWAREMTAGTERPLPDTELARQPAPSPSGRYLAFTRDDPADLFAGWSLWIRRLDE